MPTVQEYTQISFRIFWSAMAHLIPKLLHYFLFARERTVEEKKKESKSLVFLI